MIMCSQSLITVIDLRFISVGFCYGRAQIVRNQQGGNTTKVFKGIGMSF